LRESRNEKRGAIFADRPLNVRASSGEAVNVVYDWANAAEMIREFFHVPSKNEVFQFGCEPTLGKELLAPRHASGSLGDVAPSLVPLVRHFIPCSPI
jgi:hypothetical protein